MLRRILIGIENTRASTDALSLGILWARRCGATLVGLGVVDEPGIRAIEPAWPVGGKPGVDPVYYMGYEPRITAVKNQVGQLLDRFAGRCAQDGVLHERALRIGSPHEQIRLEALSCDLIILGRGSRFRFTAADDEAGDTLRKVLKDAPCPVVVAPATTCTGGPVVIAYDGSLQATRALAAFCATGLGESGQSHVISVGSSPNEAIDYVERAHKFLRDHKIESVPHALSRSEPPAAMILELLGHVNAGLLVMGAYGQPVLREFFLGSVTRTLLEESGVPLFLYH